MPKIIINCDTDPAWLSLIIEDDPRIHRAYIRHDGLAQALGNLHFDQPGKRKFTIYDLQAIGRVIEHSTYVGTNNPKRPEGKRKR